MNPVHEKMLAYFEYGHLSARMARVSQPFGVLARRVASDAAELGYDEPETTVALRKLLEAKDAAVRAAIVRSDPDAARG